MPVDSQGNRHKRYFTNVTGRANFLERQTMAIKTGETRYAARMVPKNATLKFTAALPLILAEGQTANPVKKRDLGEYILGEA